MSIIYDELFEDVLNKRTMSQEERDFLSLFADGDDNGEELENPNDNGQGEPQAGNDTQDQQGGNDNDQNQGGGDDDNGEELENPNDNGQDDQNAGNDQNQQPAPQDNNQQQQPAPQDPNAQQPAPADPNAQQQNSEEDDKEAIANKRLQSYRKHRKLAATISTLQNSVQAAISRSISADNRNMLMRIQRDLLATSGQVEYALSLDFQSINLDKVEEIYKAIEKKVTIMSDAIRKIRKEDSEN